MKIGELYFGYVNFDPNTRKLNRYNLFNSLRVQHSIAKWVTLDETEREHYDPLHFCFGDTQHRTEYEMSVKYYPGDMYDTFYTVDTYSMYVEPNRDYLLSLVGKISKAEGKRWLKENAPWAL